MLNDVNGWMATILGEQLELWVGYIGQQFDDYSGYTDVGTAGVRAIRLEVAQALSRLATMEPKIANVCFF